MKINADYHFSHESAKPIYEKIGENCFFWFSPEAEAVIAAQEILCNGGAGSLYETVFGADNIEKYRQIYRMEAEIFKSFSTGNGNPCLIECLQECDLSEFSIDNFEKHISKITTKKLPGILLDLIIGDADSLTSGDYALQTNYLDAVVYLANVRDFVQNILDLARELKTDKFYATLDSYKSKIILEGKNLEQSLREMTPLELSDKLMRKKMFRRGPFSKFIFAPTVFNNRKVVRYIGEKQILFRNIQDTAQDNELLLKQLNALADDTRFRIVALLKEYGLMQGTDIVDKVSLRSSTVSHHMKILRESGLVSEQSSGTTKLYSLTANITEEIISALKSFLP